MNRNDILVKYARELLNQLGRQDGIGNQVESQVITTLNKANEEFASFDDRKATAKPKAKAKSRRK